MPGVQEIVELTRPHAGEPCVVVHEDHFGAGSGTLDGFRKPTFEKLCAFEEPGYVHYVDRRMRDGKGGIESRRRVGDLVRDDGCFVIGGVIDEGARDVSSYYERREGYGRPSRTGAAGKAVPEKEAEKHRETGGGEIQDSDP